MVMLLACLLNAMVYCGSGCSPQDLQPAKAKMKYGNVEVNASETQLAAWCSGNISVGIAFQGKHFDIAKHGTDDKSKGFETLIGNPIGTMSKLRGDDAHDASVATAYVQLQGAIDVLPLRLENVFQQLIFDLVVCRPLSVRAIVKRAYRVVSRFDPEETTDPGHCLYAALHYAMCFKKPNNMAVKWLRGQFIYWWTQHADRLADLAEAEGISKSAYLRRYVRGHGWGGYPEIGLFSECTGVSVRVVNRQGQTLMETLENKRCFAELEYHAFHYVFKRMGERKLHSCGHADIKNGYARGGTPALTLKTRSEVDASQEVRLRYQFKYGYAAKAVDDDRFSEASDREQAKGSGSMQQRHQSSSALGSTCSVEETEGSVRRQPSAEEGKRQMSVADVAPRRKHRRRVRRKHRDEPEVNADRSAAVCDDRADVPTYPRGGEPKSKSKAKASPMTKAEKPKRGSLAAKVQGTYREEEQSAKGQKEEGSRS